MLKKIVAAEPKKNAAHIILVANILRNPYFYTGRRLLLLKEFMQKVL